MIFVSQINISLNETKKGEQFALAYSTLRGQIVSVLNGTDKDAVKLGE
jgi:hypothetical protein